MSPYLFQEAKNNIENLEYYFATNPSTSGNPLVSEFLGAIKNYQYDAIGDPLFQSILQKCRKSNVESQKILGELHKWQKYGEQEIQPSRKYLQDVIAAAIIQKANRLYQDHPSDYIKYLKNLNYQSSDTGFFTSTNFNSIDIKTILAEQSLGAIKTNYQWLNDVFPPHGGIERGQLGIISAPPGVGKSLFAMNLALCFASQGVKVLYVTLGDLVWRDWIVRLGSIAFGIPFAEAYRNMEAVYYNLQKLTQGNLEISINPSGVVSADEIVEYSMAGGYEGIFVDYDANHKGAADGMDANSSMYSSMGQIYSTYTKLSMAGRLVLMCSQPKVYAWDKVIGLADIGESKRKQETADFIITISNTASECPNHVYTVSIPKARRGKVGTTKYLIRIEGRFIEIPKGLYNQLKDETEERNYTEQQIKRMSEEFNRQKADIAASVTSKISSRSSSPIMNPFATP